MMQAYDLHRSSYTHLPSSRIHLSDLPRKEDFLMFEPLNLDICGIYTCPIVLGLYLLGLAIKKWTTLL